MKYDYLVKENHKTKNMVSENEKSLLSTNEDYKIFIDKKISKKQIPINHDDKYLYKEITDLSDSSNSSDKVKNNLKNNSKNNLKNNCDNNSVIFDSEKNTVEILVKYTSNIYNLLIKLILLIINLFVNTYEKIPSCYTLNDENNYENNDENKIIKKLNEIIKTKTKSKNKTKSKSKNKTKSKNLKEINSYLMDLD
jgi:hypothetical protein